METCPICKEKVQSLHSLDGDEFACPDCALEIMAQQKIQEEEQHESDKVEPEIDEG